eukprot:439377-Pleurochrysis_carterae.AAC.1
MYCRSLKLKQSEKGAPSSKHNWRLLYAALMCLHPSKGQVLEVSKMMNESVGEATSCSMLHDVLGQATHIFAYMQPKV